MKVERKQYQVGLSSDLSEKHRAVAASDVLDRRMAESMAGMRRRRKWSCSARWRIRRSRDASRDLAVVERDGGEVEEGMLDRRNGVIQGISARKTHSVSKTTRSASALSKTSIRRPTQLSTPTLFTPLSRR